MANALIENPENKPCVDHIDNNRANNNIVNLRWCFHSENCKNQPQKIEGKRNGVVFDNRKRKWLATARENSKNKFLGCYDTYDEARKARENFEGDNEFYKRGNYENYGDTKGKEITRKPKGMGTVRQRSNGRWRAVLRQNGQRVFDKTFTTNEEAEEYRKQQIKFWNIEASVIDTNKQFPNLNIKLKSKIKIKIVCFLSCTAITYLTPSFAVVAFVGDAVIQSLACHISC